MPRWSATASRPGSCARGLSEGLPSPLVGARQASSSAATFGRRSTRPRVDRETSSPPCHRAVFGANRVVTGYGHRPRMAQVVLQSVL